MSKRNRRKTSLRFGSKKNPGRNLNKVGQQGYFTNETVGIPRLTGLNSFVPPSMIVNLTYIDNSYPVRNHSGTTSANWRYRSSAYDVDPRLGNTAIPGFTQLSAFYRAYMVRSISIHSTVINNESEPLIVAVWPSITDLGDNALSLVTITEYGNSNPYCASHHLAKSGSGKEVGVFKKTWDNTMLYGDINWLYSDAFRTLTSATPSNLSYANFGIYLTSGGNLVNGVSTLTKVTLEILFFERNLLLS